MYVPLKIGEATTMLDPATGEPVTVTVTVTVTAVEDGRATIQVVAPKPEVPVTKAREPQPPTTLH